VAPDGAFEVEFEVTQIMRGPNDGVSFPGNGVCDLRVVVCGAEMYPLFYLGI